MRPAARKPPLEPQQARSRESLRKLLKAAVEVLGQHGVAGATIPRIAAHAGLSAGSVYRRFRGKDALLEAAILHVLARQRDRAAGQLNPEMVRQIPLPVFTEQFVAGMVAGYRANGALFRAMKQFAATREGTPFWKRASKLEVEAVAALAEIFLVHRGQMKVPRPREAVGLALMMLPSTLAELATHPWPKGYARLLPPNDEALKRELVRAFLAFLGVPPR